MSVSAIRLSPTAPMTVADLQHILKDASPSAMVKLYSDAEENDEHELLEVQIGRSAVWLRPYD